MSKGRNIHRFRNHYRAYINGKPTYFAAIQNEYSGKQQTILIPESSAKVTCPINFIFSQTLKSKHRLEVIAQRTRRYYAELTGEVPSIRIHKV